jgi:LuxR family transcriptional regulator, regulator of acetate metabolism
VALARLRGAASVHGLFACATRALGESAGFGRVAAFTLDGGSLAPQSVYPCAGELPGPFVLEPGLRVAEVLRRRTTILVEDAGGDPRAVGALGGTGSFVAAPILCQERCVGLIHADRGPVAPVEQVDRDTLAVFAEGFGHALERCVLSGRLRAHAERVIALARSTEASVAELASFEFVVGSPSLMRPMGRVQHGQGLDELLTRRELEVVAMLAEGETNAGIARRLVVSEDTVKSHVKHILRKLGVHNRSQAVSRYFQAQTAR